MSETEPIDYESDVSPQRQRQQQLGDLVDRCVEHGIDALVDALMSLGKTHAAAHVVSRTGRKATVFTRLWDTREQIMKEAVENTGLSEDEVKILPSMNMHCESMQEGARHRELIEELQNNGATAKDIHESLHLSIECQNEEAPCTYTQMCDFDVDDIKLIIGHPSHAYVESYKKGRVVLIDEDAAAAYEQVISSGAAESAITNLAAHDMMDGVIDFEKKSEIYDMSPVDKVELIEDLKKFDLYDSQLALSHQGGRADSVMLLLHLLDYDRLDKSRIRRTGFEDGATVVSDFNDEGDFSIRRSADFSMTSCVIALDGTPTHEMWENRLGTDLEHIRFMDDDEREHYITEILGYNIYQTSDSRKPYGSGKYCDPKEVFTLIESIHRKHGRKTAVITSKNARDKIQDNHNVLEQHSDNYDLYFNNLRSKNDLKNHDLLAVIGSPSTGHSEVERLAAHDGFDVKITGRGDNKDFGKHGYRYFQHIAHNEIAQAIFRAGRGEDITASYIYVHSNCIPDWVPVENVASRIRNRTPQEHHTIRAMMELEAADTATVDEHVDHTRSTTMRHLDNLAADGYLEKTAEGRSSFWIDDGLKDAPYWGQMDLE
jgi:hypothetical protein